jgi:hypothetical protein
MFFNSDQEEKKQQQNSKILQASGDTEKCKVSS